MPVAYAGTPIADTGTATHLPIAQEIIYNSLPPDLGNHWSTWAQCGIYDEEINDEFVVHNMEHGHVIISYNLSDPGEFVKMTELAEDLDDLDKWGIVRPYSKIDDGTVAMTAWGVRDLVQGVDEERIRAFYGTHKRNRRSTEATELGPIPCG